MIGQYGARASFTQWVVPGDVFLGAEDGVPNLSCHQLPSQDFLTKNQKNYNAQYNASRVIHFTKTSVCINGVVCVQQAKLAFVVSKRFISFPFLAPSFLLFFAKLNLASTAKEI